MQCLEEETVLALLQGDLAGGDLRAVEEHIDACAHCRRLVSSLAEDATPSEGAGDVPLPPGTTVVGGRFELLGLAGSGGMGHIYRARDRETGKTVAVKRVDVDEARFAREARVLSELAHPAIVRYVADGRSDDGARYLAMEWLEGEDLAERLARGPLSVEETLRLGIRVADALGTAHARGVVHRDVKPSNLFLEGGDAGRVKVVDFGVARANVAGATRTRTGALLGTPGYMAPEQAKGEGEIGPRADVFALGCVLYECLTGARAFRGANVIAVLANLFTTKVPRPRALAPHVPRALDAYVARMLSRVPSRRPENG